MNKRNYDVERGLPIHLPMKLNMDGQGPLNDNERGRWGCWCMDGINCEQVWEEFTVTFGEKSNEV